MAFATELSAPERPVALPDGIWLIVEGGLPLWTCPAANQDAITP
jgi:hypothetical protein